MRRSSFRPPLADIVQCAAEPIVVTDSAQRIVLFNRAAEKMFFREAAETVGSKLDILIPLRLRCTHAGPVDLFLEAGAAAQHRAGGSMFWGLKSTGEEFPMQAFVHEHASPSGSCFSIFLQDLTESERLEQALHASRNELTRLSNALLHAKEQEMARIARELHDELGQNLTALTMELSHLEASLPDGVTDSVLRIRTMRDLVKTSFTSIRRIASDLRPMMLDDLGLVPALEWLSADFTSRYGIDVRFHAQLGSMQPATAMSTALYRIIQEALTNVARHAQAKRVWVELHNSGRDIILRVQDDGVGATPERLAHAVPKSLGLQGIRERVRQLNGSVTIQSSAHGGLCLEARLPGNPPDAS